MRIQTENGAIKTARDLETSCVQSIMTQVIRNTEKGKNTVFFSDMDKCYPFVKSLCDHDKAFTMTPKREGSDLQW
jgi:hypothetical protein